MLIKQWNLNCVWYLISEIRLHWWCLQTGTPYSQAFSIWLVRFGFSGHYKVELSSSLPSSSIECCQPWWHSLPSLLAVVVFFRFNYYNELPVQPAWRESEPRTGSGGRAGWLDTGTLLARLVEVSLSKTPYPDCSGPAGCRPAWLDSTVGVWMCMNRWMLGIIVRCFEWPLVEARYDAVHFPFIS